jgi:ketosteroid isomerase-like protein
MTTAPREIAKAFSAHRFDEAFGHLAADVSWVLPGGPPIEGRDAVTAACRNTAAALAGVNTEFTRFLTVVGTDAVVVDVIARYLGPDGTSVVSSCDIYEFVDDMVVRITSYAVELPAG